MPSCSNPRPKKPEIQNFTADYFTFSLGVPGAGPAKSAHSPPADEQAPRARNFFYTALMKTRETSE
jgi:hypothetical protein